MSDSLYIKPAEPEATCEIHALPTSGLAARLVAAMRDGHGKGGVNVCRPCVERARGDAHAAMVGGPRL